MKKIAIKAYNNSDWLSNTDFILLNLSDNLLTQITNIQNILKNHFDLIRAEVHLYNQDFDVYSQELDVKFMSPRLLDWVNCHSSTRTDYCFLEKDFDFSEIPTSESFNDVRLDTYILKIFKNTIQCKCYLKHDGNVEIWSDEININEL